MIIILAQNFLASSHERNICGNKEYFLLNKHALNHIYLIKDDATISKNGFMTLKIETYMLIELYMMK